MGRTLDISAGWQVAGASVTGISHQKAGTECQDARAVSRSIYPASLQLVTAVCVSDGAGSAAKAFAGARLTAYAVAGWLSENFPSALAQSQDKIRKSCLVRVKRLIRRAAVRSKRSLEDYAATVAAVAVGPEDRWLALHLGDGGIIGQFAEQILPVSVPDKGEFANQTWFVSSSDALEHLRIYGSPFNPGLCRPTGFVVFSDGVENSLLGRSGQSTAPAALIMLNWLRKYCPADVSEAVRENITGVFRQQSFDDCTIMVMAKTTANTVNQSYSDTIKTGRTITKTRQQSVSVEKIKTQNKTVCNLQEPANRLFNPD